ncbi:MAG: hypothetical protein NTX49_09830 [Chlamydiae bacterium]|nr:hypothetical protein [Chlamydiota bacterium]
MTSPNTIHSAPLSFQIASTLTSWTIDSRENAARHPSIASKSLVILTTATACVGAPVIICASVVEAVASGILGSISAAAHGCLGARSISLHRFTIHSLSYAVNSLLGPIALYATLIPGSSTKHSTILPQLLMGTYASRIDECVGNYFDTMANRGRDERLASSNELYKDLLRRVTHAIKQSISPSDHAGHLHLALFKMKLKENNIDIDSQAPLTITNIREIDSEFRIAKELCLSQEEIPDHLRDNPTYFREVLAELVEAATPSMTCEKLVAMIRNSEGVFSFDSVEQRESEEAAARDAATARIYHHRLFRETAGYSPSEEILTIMAVLDLQPRREADIAPIGAITARIPSSRNYEEQLQNLVRAAYTVAHRDMPELFFVEIQDTDREQRAQSSTRQQRIANGRENLSTMSAFDSLARYTQYLEIACGTQAVPWGQYPERQRRIEYARGIFRNLLPSDKQLLITKLIAGDQIDSAISALPEDRRLRVQNLIQQISLLSTNFTMPLRDGDDGYVKFTPNFRRVEEFLATLRDSFNQSYLEIAQ